MVGQKPEPPISAESWQCGKSEQGLRTKGWALKNAPERCPLYEMPYAVGVETSCITELMQSV